MQRRSCFPEGRGSGLGVHRWAVEQSIALLRKPISVTVRRRLPGYGTATPDTLQRQFLSTGGIILNRRTEIVVRLNRRTYSPVLRQASLPETITVPWWGNRTLRYEYA